MNDLHLSTEVHIGSWDVTPWMSRVQRTSTLCNPGEEFTITLSPDMPYDIIPNQEITIYEQSVKVLNGFVTSVIRTHGGGGAVINIIGTDKYKLARDGFIEDYADPETDPTSMWISQGEDVNEWMSRLTEHVGLEYRSDNREFDKRLVAPLTNFSLMGVGDAINLVTTYAGGYIYTDVNGRIHMRRGPRAEPYLHFAPGIYTDPITSTSGSIISAQWEHSDKVTRDVARVFGTAWNGAYYIPAEASIDLGLPAHRTMVYASPMVQTFEEAQRLADRMIEEAGRWTDIYRFEIAGNPGVHIGRGVYWEGELGGIPNSGSGIITNVDTVTDEKGYVQVVTLNERCPKIAGWQLGGVVKCLWIAAHARGTSDPRPEKLIFALTPIGLGQPTFHIVKTLPSGEIIGMCPYHSSGLGVFLALHQPGTFTSQLWFSENPSNQDPEWTLLLSTGDSLSGGYVVDTDFFGITAIGSMSCVGNTLYIGVRGRDGDDNRFNFYNSYKNGVWGNWEQQNTHGQFQGAAARVTKDYFASNYIDSLNTGAFIHHTTGNPVFTYIPSGVGFSNGIRNGVTDVPGNFGVGGIWINDLPGASDYIFGVSDGSMGYIKKNGANTFTTPLSGTYLISPRGDYAGSQTQFVLPTTPTLPYHGDLYKSFDGSSYSNMASWLAGIVICGDYEDPTQMIWMPYMNDNANEVMRISIDGGATWANATGNWWGTNSEVLSGSKMQSDGGLNLIDFHPTFLI